MGDDRDRSAPSSRSTPTPPASAGSEAARDKRVEVVPELSGNCQLAGRELPPAAVLAASENMTARALRAARGRVSGGMVLRRWPTSRPSAGWTPWTASPVDDRPGAAGPDVRAPAGSRRDRPRRGDRWRPRRRGWRARPAGPAARQPRPRPRPGGRGDPGGVRGAGEPDHPAGHAAGAGRAARDAVPDRARRPRAGPRPGRRRGPQPPLHLVRDRHRTGSPAADPRLRPAPAPPGRTRHRRPRRARLHPR